MAAPEDVFAVSELDASSTGDLMRRDWNRRADENARWYIASDAKDEIEFSVSGRIDVERALRGFNREWLRTSDLLEIGCGIGRMSQYLAPAVRSLTAVDVSTEMIAQATERLGHLPGTTFYAIEGTDLHEFPDDSFDVVCSYVVFQHIPKPVVVRYLDDARRVLRGGGVLRAQLARLDHPVTPPDDDTFTMRSWTVEELHEVLAPWRCTSIETIRVGPDVDHLWVTSLR